MRIAITELTGDRYTMPAGTTTSYPPRVMKSDAKDNWQCPRKVRGHCDWETSRSMCKCIECTEAPGRITCILEVPRRLLEAAAEAAVIGLVDGPDKDTVTRCTRGSSALKVTRAAVACE